MLIMSTVVFGQTGCSVTVNAKTTQQFLAEIPRINSQLANCPIQLPKGAGMIMSSGDTDVAIAMNNRNTEHFAVTTASGKIVAIAQGASVACTQKVAITENNVDAVLAGGPANGGQIALNLAATKQVTVKGCTFFSKLRLFFFNPVFRFFAKKAAVPAPTLQSAAQPTPTPANCGQLGEQCNNRGCLSGICGAPKEQNADGQWGFWNYRCLDQQQYDANCVGRGNTPAAWSCLTGPCR